MFKLLNKIFIFYVLLLLVQPCVFASVLIGMDDETGANVTTVADIVTSVNGRTGDVVVSTGAITDITGVDNITVSSTNVIGVDPLYEIKSKSYYSIIDSSINANSVDIANIKISTGHINQDLQLFKTVIAIDTTSLRNDFIAEILRSTTTDYNIMIDTTSLKSNIDTNYAISTTSLNQVMLSTTALNNSIVSTTTINTIFAQYESVYVDPINGDDSTGNGLKLKPFQTIQTAINSFTAGSPHVIYVNGSTTDDITFRANDQSMKIIFDPKTQHSGTINLVQGNTSIYFICSQGLAYLTGTVNDASSGNIYWEVSKGGIYNKTGGSGAQAPIGYVQFGYNSTIDGLIVNLTGNTTFRTLGTGSMGTLTQSNGLFIGQHQGSIICPAISGGANPLIGIPICLLQGNLQLISSATKSLTCNASYGLVYLAGISTFQNDFSSYGKIDFTGAGVNVFCYVWSNSQLAISGDIYPPTGALLPNSSLYLNASRTPTNYSTSGINLKNHLDGIDTAIGLKAIKSDVITATTTINNNLNSVIISTGIIQIQINNLSQSTTTLKLDIQSDYNSKFTSVESSTSSLKSLIDNIIIPTNTVSSSTLELATSTLKSDIQTDYNSKFTSVESSTSSLKSLIDNIVIPTDTVSSSTLETATSTLKSDIQTDYNSKFTSVESSTSSLKSLIDNIVVPTDTVSSSTLELATSTLVSISGSTMTGDLTSPNLTATNTVTASTGTFTSSVKIDSTATFYLGDSEENGTYRIIRGTTSLDIERRENSVWVNKGQFLP